MTRKKALLFGFAALFLCGIGDWLIGYDPPGGESLIYGISNTAIAAVPSWYYILSLGFGILSGLPDFSELSCFKLTIVFCENNERIYGLLPLLSFMLTSTLGNVADRCDFRLKRL